MHRIAVSCLALAALCACQPPAPRGGGGSGNNNPTGCTADSECSAGQVCRDGACAAPTAGCTADTDCAADQICDQGTCRPAPEPTCTDDGDCTGDQICIEGACVNPQPPACVIRADCTGDQICREGACTDPDCRADNDCRINEDCREGLCVTSENFCAGDDDCQGGQICTENRCVAPDCTRHVDCGNGEVCIAGRCETGTACTLDGDCTRDEICEQRRCQPAQCAEDTDCQNNALCRARRCVQAEGHECRTHTDCEDLVPGLICMMEPGDQVGQCGAWSRRACTQDDACFALDSRDNATWGGCEEGTCRVGSRSRCSADAQCLQHYRCLADDDQVRRCERPCETNSVCRPAYICGEESRCTINWCGQRDEVSEVYEHLSGNGSFNATCGADGASSGTCSSRRTNAGNWYGVCFEAGSVALGRSCDYWGNQRDAANRCVPGAYCRFNRHPSRGVCVPRCSPAGSPGSVRCPGAMVCNNGMCINPNESCDPTSRAAQDGCGADGACFVFDWRQDLAQCLFHYRERHPIDARCGRSSQCANGSLCWRGSGSERHCRARCRTDGSATACHDGTRCTPITELIDTVTESVWGICLPP